MRTAGVVEIKKKRRRLKNVTRRIIKERIMTIKYTSREVDRSLAIILDYKY